MGKNDDIEKELRAL